MDDIYFPAVVRLRFVLEARAAISLPPFTGSTWRGLLGTALRRSVCVPGLERCDACLITPFCAFYRFFEQGALTERQDPRYRSSSPPFVLDLLGDYGRVVQPGEPLAVGLNIIGDSIDFIPDWVYAIQCAGTLGVGQGCGRFELVAVLQERLLGSDSWEPIWQRDAEGIAAIEPQPVAFPEPPPVLDLELLTPLRIKRQSALVGEGDLTAAELLRHLCIRLDRIEQQLGRGGEPCFWPRYRGLVESLPKAQARVHWHDWTRYSSRQQQYMKLGGLVGRLRIPEQAMPGLWPAIWLGQWVHVGKNTSFGLGAYRVVAPE